jgi:Holliday junction DNA helicase RuvB
VEIDTYSLSFVFIKSTNGNTKMNLRKWLSKTKETITTTTTTLDTVVLLTANNNSNNKKLSEKQQEEKDKLFEDIIGYDDIKRLFRMAINANDPVHILLIGPPASAKTLFMRTLTQLQNSYFTDGGNSTKAGMIDYIFNNEPKYLLIDEIDKMSTKDQTFLLNLMETGIVSETKHGKTRTIHMKTWVFASSNNITNITRPLKSRFFPIKFKPYTYEQFYEITVKVLKRQNINEEIAKATANAVWKRIKSGDIRSCIRIARMAKSVQDIDFITETFLKYYEP